MHEVCQRILKKRIFGSTHEQMQLVRRLGGTSWWYALISSLHKYSASSLVGGSVEGTTIFLQILRGFLWRLSLH